MLNHQATVHSSKSFPKTLCRLTAIAAVAGFAAVATMPSHAASSGELLDIEMPSMRTPVEAMPTANMAPMATVKSAALTRADVRESLAVARLANLVTPGGEMGDNADVLQAREDFNALQTEVLQAEYRMAALQLQQAQMDALVAQAEGFALTPSQAALLEAEAATDEPGVEVVVVASDKVYEMLLEGGHAADRRDADATEAHAPVAVLLLVNESAPNRMALVQVD